jgi:hypothetical protein
MRSEGANAEGWLGHATGQRSSGALRRKSKRGEGRKSPARACCDTSWHGTDKADYTRPSSLSCACRQTRALRIVALPDANSPFQEQSKIVALSGVRETRDDRKAALRMSASASLDTKSDAGFAPGLKAHRTGSAAGQAGGTGGAGAKDGSAGAIGGGAWPTISTTC